MATITFGGLATGLNTQAIVDGLAAVERRPITLLKNQQGRLQDKIKLYQDLRSKLAALRTAAAKLSTSAGFFVKAAKSSDENVLVATAGSAANSASHSITVGSLARSSTLASTAFADIDTTTVGSGALAITVGAEAFDIVIDDSNNSLSGLRDAINASGAPVAATILTVTAGATPSYRLVVSGKNTGLENAATVNEAGLSGGTAPGFATTQAAADAAFTVDGIAVARASNVIGDVIPGVTLDLKSSSINEIQVAVNDDIEAIKTQFNDFIAAYNEVATFIADKTKYDSANKSAGPLIGDATLASLKRSLQSILTTPVTGSPAILGEIGVATQKNGTISVDTAKLNAALETNLAGVGNLFTSATDGLARSVMNFADGATRLGDGVLSARIDGAQSEISKIGDRIARKEDSISRLIDHLTRKFTAMEALVSQLNAQGNFLAQQLEGLNALTKK
jgi:flagellar hook-associated protein 2